MTNQNHPHSAGEKLVHAYNTMLQRVKTFLDEAEKETRPKLDHAIEAAKEKATELEELTLEEAEKIGTYLKRDVEDAASYLAGPERAELADWLKLDIQLIENRILDAFMSVADRTRVGILKLEQDAPLAGVTYHTGEVTGIGTLVCTECGELLHFKQTGHIPPCPVCHKTTFVRQKD
jgi:hypothetical protein